MYKNIAIFTIILLFGVYTLLLYYTGKLTFYIHPRYLDFSYLAAIIAVLFASIGLQRQIPLLFGTTKRKFAPSFDWWLVLLLLPIVLGFSLPVKPLSAATASQRIVDLSGSIGKSDISIEGFGSNTKILQLGDWVKIISNSPDYSTLTGKELDITGFVHFAPNQPESTFTVSRFILTCCAVDARPVGIVVKFDGKTFDENQWVRVQGEFIGDTNTDYKYPVIDAEAVDLIDVPNNPYIY